MFTALALAACAQEPSVPPPTAPLARIVAYRLADLPGWEAEDHVGALRALRAACAVTRDPAMRPVCAALPDYPSEQAARAFLERSLLAVPVAGTGLLTGYFMPIYRARETRGGEFTAPLRPRPADLPAGNTSAAGHAAYDDRSEIEERPAPGALAWMRPEDLFFMQIQGAGVLVFPGGERAKAVFAGSNGAPFVGVAQAMRAQGLLADDDTSAQAIHSWLADHRGPEAKAIMDLDPRYVFYSLTADDGLDPLGSAGARLPPGRAVAVDPAFHAMGEVLWLDATAPSLTGAFPTYRRLVAALDTGSAIKGPARADLYLGRGPLAGAEAGRVRHALTLYRLLPR
ncbi:MAG: MltA domain-containing protein [Caulobacteraceae bacterium]